MPRLKCLFQAKPRVRRTHGAAALRLICRSGRNSSAIAPHQRPPPCEFPPLPTETIGLRKVKQRQRAHRTVSVPADRVLKAIIAPKKFTTYDESRRTEDANIPGKVRFLH